MKYTIKHIFSVAALTLLLSSCSSSTNVTKMRSASTSPDIVRLEMTLDDYEYLGETEINVEYLRYFGVFSYVNAINGNAVTARNKSFVYLQGRSPINLGSPLLNRALIKAYKAYPDADFLMPSMTAKEIEKLFLGRKVKMSAKIKSYKIRK
ncbi:MAG: hypothetical protein ACJAV5_001686 [Vicingaceae bacterium]|jgi:hypothetical protein